MIRNTLFSLLAIASTSTAAAIKKCDNSTGSLRVENFLNPAQSLDVVSSLIIGSEAAVIIDLPLAVPQADALAQWVKNTTDKPLVAAFSTHSHPDHYLSGAAFLAKFPETKYYANSKSVELIKGEANSKIQQWKGILGEDSIVDNVTLPTPYDFTFFALPGDEATPIYLVSPVVGDTIDETAFWIPSISTVIVGDLVYSRTMHLWVSDSLTTALSEAWLSTLDFIESLGAKRIIPGHSLTLEDFDATTDLQHTRDYVTFFKDEVQAKGEDAFTPKEIFSLIDNKFPGLLSNESTTSATLLNITSEQFGKDGTRQAHFTDFTAFNNLTELNGWQLTNA
ncbi:Metallo-hydrolase/oxidoreductase [Aaosphaeria arxii CBS 175.79]|uniref:Metallo-hydrolase/oxidoreductase n=1 Tax=Aaosphaeria arxii CBS 175.79 TaxID=1450172 RepID=A0A6A5Y7I8_9PLEO|nr:Metallo-hydrolase/oxidoreductase [Aaosphaeria arxii CBS 175.79]KAF2021498.1 Metallo-hydrolase/oxidoreductase [Aaosphaeria arxii CBS 175.79]